MAIGCPAIAPANPSVSGSGVQRDNGVRAPVSFETT